MRPTTEHCVKMKRQMMDARIRGQGERKDLAGEMKRPAARAARNLRQAEPGAADWPPAPGRAGEDERAPSAKPHWCRGVGI